MKFRTEYKATKAPFVIDPKKPVVLLGSCFADNISAKMKSCLWEAENPLGTLYNPLSIARALSACLWPEESLSSGVSEFEDSLFNAGGMWRSWLFDSKLSAETREDVVYAFGQRCKRIDSLLKGAGVLFVTFGTSWCYYIKDRVVANCHKQPAALFERRRLAPDEIVGAWKRLVMRLRECYPGLKVVFTVSPVRHLKDGFEGNARSKAILLLATEEMCRSVEHCYYFPAYEIVNDDLRDYRFYASDLVHPSDEAVEYIWEKFKEMYIDEQGEKRLKEGEAIRKGLEHRPLPCATRQPSEDSARREHERREALLQRYRAFTGESSDGRILC